MKAEDWSEVSVSQGTPRIAGNHQKLGETPSSTVLSLTASEGTDHPCRHLEPRLLAPRTVRRYISVILSHQVHGALSWQLWDTKDSSGGLSFPSFAGSFNSGPRQATSSAKPA